MDNKKNSDKSTTPVTQPQRPSQPSDTQQSMIDEQDVNVLPSIDPEAQHKQIMEIYGEIVKWRRNLFDVPRGNVGKKFVDEMTNQINSWCVNSNESSLVLLMIMPAILLQRTAKSCKGRVNKEHLRRRMEMWEQKKYVELLQEGKAIQNRLPLYTNSKKSEEDLVKQFRNYMLKGNVNGALRLLSKTSNSGILPINEETVRQLHEKHPEGEVKHEEMLLQGPINYIHPVIFDGIDAELVQKVTLRTKGASGPSNFDANDWRGIVGSRSFGTSSNDLCVAIANLAKKLCTESADDDSVAALMGCRLLPLDKNPGLRPVGVGEVLRRISGKMVVFVLRPDLQENAGDLQLCAGQQSGCEAGIHAMHDIFVDDDTHGIIQVDANNAFNTINRNVFLHNIHIICPEVATFIMNCYQKPARLFVVGGIEIQSLEGTTQGDPTAMYVYALGILPLIVVLSDIEKVRQSAFADDLAGGGNIDQLKRWWDLIVMMGKFIGYFAKPSKSWLIVKEQYKDYAEIVFKGTGIRITTEGKRHLGAVIGTPEFKEEYVNDMVDNWIEELKSLSIIARVEPHIAYTAYVFGFQHKYTYFLRTIPDISSLLKRLDAAIDEYFLKPIVNGHNFNYSERQWYSLPPRLGGLGIIIPSEVSDIFYNNSKQVTADLVNRIVNQHKQRTEIGENEEKAVVEPVSNKYTIKNEKNKRNEEKLKYVKSTLTPVRLKLLEAISEKGASVWLTTMPIKEHGFYLSKQIFWDTIHLRYGLPLKRLPLKCACSKNFSVEHALNCKKGGYVHIRHNEIRDLTAEMLDEVCRDVQVEPLLTPLSGETFKYKTAITDDHARTDVAARDVWIKGSRAHADVKVFNPLAQVYQNQTLKAAHKSNENGKKRAYNERVQNVEHGTFTPLVFTCFGGMSVECTKFYNRISDMIAEKRNISGSLARNWVRTKLCFSLLKTTNLCLRGSKTVKRDEEEYRKIADTNIEMAAVDSKMDVVV